jgi:hypothetical protein
MVSLRNQRLEEALQKEKMRRQDMAALGGGIGDLFSSIGKGLARSRQDAIANQLMAQAMPIPRAQAVDPALQESADAAAAEMPGFFRGGTDELDMRMQMAEMRAEQMRATQPRTAWRR